MTRVGFSTGDEFDQPEQGLFMGALVNVRAMADDQETPSGEDVYALVGGHHFDGDVITVLDAFEPALDYMFLNEGERASGWLVFDVPARHGQIVLLDSVDGHQLGSWTY